MNLVSKPRILKIRLELRVTVMEKISSEYFVIPMLSVLMRIIGKARLLSLQSETICCMAEAALIIKDLRLRRFSHFML